MTISVVNGYVCESSCDVAKAKKGEDPHPDTGSGGPPTGGATPGGDGPAVLFGGRLADLPASAVFTPFGGAGEAATGDSNTPASRPSGTVLDILA